MTSDQPAGEVEMWPDEKAGWMTSHALANCLIDRRDNDVKVDVNGCLVPIAGFEYEPNADVYVLSLVDGEDLRIALTTDSIPESESKELDMHYQFHGRNSVNLLLDHHVGCLCIVRGGGVKPGEEQLNNPRMEKIDPLCIAGVLVSDRRPS